MKKGIIYFYRDKQLYISGLISLYLGVSLFMFLSISDLGEVVIAICSLIFTVSIIQFTVRKVQTAKGTAWPFLMFVLLSSCNFYSHLLSNQQIYPVLFIVVQFGSVLSFCVLYVYVIRKDKWYIVMRIIFFIGLLIFFLYTYLGLLLTFWHSGALTIFTLIQAACIVPMLLIIQENKQFSSVYTQLDYRFFTGKSMIIHNVMMFLILLLWDVFFLFLVYQYIMKQFL